MYHLGQREEEVCFSHRYLVKSKTILAFFFNFEEKTPTPDQLTAEDWGIH
jgi:hypothetical protein